MKFHNSPFAVPSIAVPSIAVRGRSPSAVGRISATPHGYKRLFL